MRNVALGKDGSMPVSGLIDLHNHIVYGVDDGAVDLGESLAIARQFAAEGVSTVVATPHLDADRMTGPSPELVRERVGEIQEAIAVEGLGIELYPGNELYVTPDAVDMLQQGSALCLASSTAVLVEVSMHTDKMPMFFADTVFRLQLAGYQVVLAHPERYGFVQRDPASLDDLIDRGVALQLTAPALLGEYGAGIRRTAERLIRRGSYQLAASDRHHPGPNRSLSALYERLTTMAGESTARVLLRENPSRLLAGKALRTVEVEEDDEPNSLLERLFGRHR